MAFFLDCFFTVFLNSYTGYGDERDYCLSHENIERCDSAKSGSYCWSKCIKPDPANHGRIRYVKRKMLTH